jgi:hypothetical protein
LRPNSPRAAGPSAARGRLPSSVWDAGSLRARRNPDSTFARCHSGAPVGGRGSSRTMRHQPRDKVRKVRRASILRTYGVSCQVRLSGRYDGRRAGAVAERLGRGLQSLVHRFESGPRLTSHRSSRCFGLIPCASTSARSRATSLRSRRTLRPNAVSLSLEKRAPVCSGVLVGAAVRDLAEEADPPSLRLGALRVNRSTQGAGNNGFLRLRWRACRATPPSSGRAPARRFAPSRRHGGRERWHDHAARN